MDDAQFQEQGAVNLLSKQQLLMGLQKQPEILVPMHLWKLHTSQPKD